MNKGKLRDQKTILKCRKVDCIVRISNVANRECLVLGL